MRKWYSGEPEENINITYVILYGDQYSNGLVLGYYDCGAWYDLQNQLLRKTNVLLWFSLPDWAKYLEEKFNKKTGE